MTYSECKKIAFAEKKEEWEFLFEYKKTSEPDLQIIAVTPEVDFYARFYAKEIGLTVEDFYKWEEICNYGDLNINVIEDLADEYDRIFQEIGHNYPHIQWISARAFFHTLKGFLDSLVLRTLPVCRVFQYLKPMQVFCFIQEEYLINGPCLLDKPSYSLTARIVPLVAQKYGCSITWIADEQQGETSRMDPGLLAPSIKQDELERRIDEFRITLHEYETISSDSKIESNPVLISDNGVDDYLSQITEIWNVNNGRLPDFTYNNIWVHFNQTAVRELCIELGKQLWTKINESSTISNCFHIEDINLYSIAQPLLQRITLVDMPAMLIFVTGLEYSLKEYKQAVILLGGIEYQTYVIAKCASDLGIPMVSIHKGGYMGYSLLPMHERYDFADCDYFICNGIGAQRTFQNPCELAFWRKDRERAEPVPLGAIWLDALIQKNRGTSQKMNSDVNENLILSEKKTIMYIMSALLGDNTYLGYVYHPEIWYIRFQLKLIDLLRQYPEIRVLIKPPLPGRYPQIYNPVIDWLKEQNFPNVTILENIPLEDVMHPVDTFIVDSPSTPLLQLLTIDKPVIIYADSRFFKMMPAAVGKLRKRVIYTDNEQQFYEAVDTFIKKADWALPEPINTEFLREYGTHLHDGKSAERIVGFLMSLAKNYKKENGNSAMTLCNLIRGKIKNIIGETRAFFPTQLSIETVCGCNAKCIMCPSGSITRSKGIIKSEVHRLIIDKVAAAGAPINFITHAGMGEPLLDPLLEERIQYEKSVFPNAKVAVYSNGSLLAEERAINLIKSGLDILSFSVNAYRPETYEQVMHLPREKTYYNIERFLELNRRAGSPVSVHVSLIKTDICTDEEVNDFRNYWNSRVNAVITPPVINWGGKLNIGCQQQREQLPCFYIWKVLMVDHDGTVKMCCEDYDSKYPMGNLLTQSLEEIFNSFRMIQQRDEQLQGRFTCPDICRNCVETFEIAEDFWQNGVLVPAPNKIPLDAHNDSEEESIFKEERALVSKIRSMDPKKYKRFLGVVLSEGLSINSFDYPQGIWPPPTPARMYISEFLTKYSPDVHGRCVEFYPAVYYKMFMGNPAITSYDVWNVTPVNGATVFGDLQNAASISDSTFDTIICTHVLSAIPNIAKAVSEMRRILSPGGLVLCTVPCVLQKYAPDPQDFWRFTRDSLKTAFSQFSRFELCSFGNAAAVAGSPYFLMTNHFPEDVLHCHDEFCPSIIAIAAWK